MLLGIVVYTGRKRRTVYFIVGQTAWIISIFTRRLSSWGYVRVCLIGAALAIYLIGHRHIHVISPPGYIFGINYRILQWVRHIIDSK